VNGRPRVVVYGLGPVGAAIAREVLRRGACEVVGAADRDPAKAGRDLGELLGLGRALGVRVEADPAAPLAAAAPDLVILTTASALEAIRPQVLECVAHGAAVVTTCEELSYPWATRPDLARELDEAARRAGVAVLSTGVNPGFLMDYLPAAVSGLCREVRRVSVERIQDAGPRRQAFRDKIGAGLAAGEFRARAARGALRHVGLPESVHLIAAALGWELSRVEETIEPVFAGEDGVPARGAERIAAGAEQVARGVEQVARGWVGGEERIALTFRAAVGEPAPRDRLVIDGVPPIDLTIAGGVHGDLATCNVVVNAIPAVLRAPPGLRTMLDLGVVSARG
jgi:4-hydroxy-tetrahydrodipicolinate reductase